MKILLINDFYSLHGGKERHFFDLAHELEKRGHSVSIIYSIDDGRVIEDERPKYFLPGLLTYHGTRETKSRLRRLLEIEKPDIVHIHNHIPNIFLIRHLLTEVRVIWTVHDVEIICPARYYLYKGEVCERACGIGCLFRGCVAIYPFWKRRLEINTYKAVSHIISPSHYLKRLLVKNGFREEKISVIPNFIEIAPELKERKENVILHVGRLHRLKGVQNLLRACASIKNEEYRLVIVGAGNYEKELKAVTKELRLEKKVTFIGWLKDEEITKSYMEAKVFILPTIMPENCPTTIQRAMSYSLPVVATAVGGIPELVSDGQTGFLVNPRNIEDMAEKITILLRDEILRERFGRAAREKAQINFNPTIQVDKIERIYRSLL